MSNLKKAVNLALKFISTKEMNPYVVEWGLHYVSGTQETKTLPESLKHCTLQQCIWGLINECTFSPSTGEGHTRWLPYMGNSDWYTHPTMGVVGGFTWKLKSYEDKFVLVCEDTWDFNADFDCQSYKIPLPDGAPIGIIRRALKALGLDWLETSYDSEEDTFLVGVKEGMLSQFNEQHAFKTVWELELPNGLACDIDAEIGYRYRRAMRAHHRRRKKLLRSVCRPW